jgi:V/A-type H+-transporting ATPase subunit A
MIESSPQGVISSIKGSLIEIKGIENDARLFDLLKVVKHNILGEIIQIHSEFVVAQCFESTHMLSLGEEVVVLNQPLSMELAPGLLTKTFDGIQRPLEETFKNSKEGKLERGFEFIPLSREKKWHFIPLRKINDKISSGDVIGVVNETLLIDHKIMVPHNVSGQITYIAEEGDYTIVDEIYRVKTGNSENSHVMLQKWPITKSRTFNKRLLPNEPLITGTRIIDLLFPIAKGGTFGIPGGFGTGKTVIQQTISKYCNADIIVFIGCGEPGNEIANVLKQFAEIIDPINQRPLMERVVVIANTSNMPVSAREASLFSGVTIAEYYRDMGFDVAVIADSMSRWAEALREISGLLEEMPAEEGYPAYLPSKLSSFYERAGVVTALGLDHSGNERVGSLTIIGTISPPAGDFSEPVTATTKRVVQGILTLDNKLAYSKQYPAINWLNSYSNYPEHIADWWKQRNFNWSEIDLEWLGCREQINDILSQENDLKSVIKLLGQSNLPEEQKLTLLIADLVRKAFLIQNAFDEIDNFTDYKKLLGIVKIILLLYQEGKKQVEKGYIINEMYFNDVINDISKISHTVANEDFHVIEEFKDHLINDRFSRIFNIQHFK